MVCLVVVFGVFARGSGLRWVRAGLGCLILANESCDGSWGGVRGWEIGWHSGPGRKHLAVGSVSL